MAQQSLTRLECADSPFGLMPCGIAEANLRIRPPGLLRHPDTKGRLHATRKFTKAPRFLFSPIPTLSRTPTRSSNFSPPPTPTSTPTCILAPQSHDAHKASLRDPRSFREISCRPLCLYPCAVVPQSHDAHKASLRDPRSFRVISCRPLGPLSCPASDWTRRVLLRDGMDRGEASRSNGDERKQIAARRSVAPPAFVVARQRLSAFAPLFSWSRVSASLDRISLGEGDYPLQSSPLCAAQAFDILSPCRRTSSADVVNYRSLSYHSPSIVHT